MLAIDELGLQTAWTYNPQGLVKTVTRDAGDADPTQRRTSTYYYNDQGDLNLSNTILIGEKAYDVTKQAGSWYYDEGYFTGGSKGTARDAPGLSPDGPNINYKDNWGSPHNDCVVFLFADGTVRRLSYDIDVVVMAALLTPDGNEGVTPP